MGPWAPGPMGPGRWKLWTVGIGLSSPGPLGSCGLLVLDCPVPDLNYVGLRPPCVILGWAPEGAQPKITLNVGLRPPFAPAARFPVGPYLAPPRNLPLGELLDTSFGAVRSPISPFFKFGPNCARRATPSGVEPGLGRQEMATQFFPQEKPAWEKRGLEPRGLCASEIPWNPLKSWKVQTIRLWAPDPGGLRRFFAQKNSNPQIWTCRRGQI